MRMLICALALTTVAAGAETKKKKSPAAKAAVSKPAPAVTVPEDAERIGEQTYRKREADGKVYVYTKTPFGVARMEEKAIVKPAAAEQELDVSVQEDGDTVRFERTGPFGKNVWTRKKTELSAEERGLLDKSRAKK